MNPDAMCTEQAADNIVSNDNNQAHEILPEVLPEDYVLQPYDIMSGRGRTTFNSIGNRRFRVTLALALKQYKSTQRRKEKTLLINSIVETVRSNGGRFLNRKNGRWVDIGDRAAREKVAHAMRDMISGSQKKMQRQKLTNDDSTRPCSTSSSAVASLESSECGSADAGHTEHQSNTKQGSQDHQEDISNNDEEAQGNWDGSDEFDQLIASLAASGYASGGDNSPLPCHDLIPDVDKSFQVNQSFPGDDLLS